MAHVFNKSYRFIRNTVRRFSVKVKVKLDEQVSTSIENGDIKPRYHPGIINPKNVKLPDDYLKAIDNVISECDSKQLVSDARGLSGHLQFRFPPSERDALKEKKKELMEKILSKTDNVKLTNESDVSKHKQSLNDKLQLELKRAIYNWVPINYNVHTALVYLIGRVAQEYAVLVHIFSEIALRDKEFKPRSFFDFGSGTGTGMWAAKSLWIDSIFEYFNVDSSPDMNDLAQILLQGGIGNKPSMLKGVFFRQFLPATNAQYDIVVCAYSLLELPSLQSRLQTITKLWNKTAQYLIIVEQGTKASFKVVNEVRDFILNIEGSNCGHVFSPCPHDTICPKFLLDKKPCSFDVRYNPLPIMRIPRCLTESFSYVVLKKGERKTDEVRWPRIVEPTLVRSKHSICRMCTSEGKIDEVIFTASKYGKTTYHCARSSTLGDLLPIKQQDPSKI